MHLIPCTIGFISYAIKIQYFFFISRRMKIVGLIYVPSRLMTHRDPGTFRQRPC